MSRKIGALMLWAMVLIVVAIVADLLGHSPLDKIRELVKGKEIVTKEALEEKRATDKVVADENRLACLAYLIWHANWLNGNGDREKAMLIGVVAKNLQKVLNTDLCTIFSNGLIELPEKRTPAAHDFRIHHDMKVVSTQASTPTRSVQYADALTVAQKVNSAEDPVALLAPRYRSARCATHLLRAKFGWLVWSTAGKRANIREALVAQHGEPVLTAADGTEFFGRCDP